MRPEDEVVIHITCDKKIYVETRYRHTESFKRVDSASVMECLKKSVNHTVRLDSGVLPNNCISFSGNDRGDRFVVIVFDDGYADISLEKTQYKNFPLPRLVFGFVINGSGKITGVRLGVTERGRLTPRSKMYVYPFTNVKDFNLCIGSNQMPQIKSLHQLNSMPYFILSMPNNYDLYKENRTKLNLNCRELFEHLKDKDSDYYYSDVMKEMGRTLNDFIEGGMR